MEGYKEVEPTNYNINCNTDGSKLDDNRTVAVVLINNSHNIMTLPKKPFIL